MNLSLFLVLLISLNVLNGGYSGLAREVDVGSGLVELETEDFSVDESGAMAEKNGTNGTPQLIRYIDENEFRVFNASFFVRCACEMGHKEPVSTYIVGEIRYYEFDSKGKSLGIERRQEFKKTPVNRTNPNPEFRNFAVVRNKRHNNRGVGAYIELWEKDFLLGLDDDFLGSFTYDGFFESKKINVETKSKKFKAQGRTAQASVCTKAQSIDSTKCENKLSSGFFRIE